MSSTNFVGLTGEVVTVDADAIRKSEQQQAKNGGEVFTGCRDFWNVRYDPRLCLLDGNWPGNRLVFKHDGIKEAITKAWGITIQ